MTAKKNHDSKILMMLIIIAMMMMIALVMGVWIIKVISIFF